MSRSGGSRRLEWGVGLAILLILMAAYTGSYLSFRVNHSLQVFLEESSTGKRHSIRIITFGDSWLTEFIGRPADFWETFYLPAMKVDSLISGGSVHGESHLR